MALHKTQQAIAANVIPHPHALTCPPIQKLGPGRRPKNVVNMFAFRRDKNVALALANKEDHALRVLTDSVAMYERAAESLARQLIAFKLKRNSSI